MNISKLQLFIFSLIAVLFTGSQSLALAEDKDRDNSKHYQLNISIDRYYSPFMGNELISNVNIPLNFVHRHIKNEFLNDIVGLLEFYPAFYFSVLQHEVYGHGFRARENGNSIKKYEIGFSGGLTTPEETPKILYHQYSVFAAGGHQANKIAASETAGKFLTHERLSWFDSWYYSINKFLLLNEFMDLNKKELNPNISGVEKEKFLQSRDTGMYITNLNVLAQRKKDLIKFDDFNITFLDLLDPIFLNPLFYLASGRDIPFIKISTVKYLPACSVLLSPYGLEVELANYLKLNEFPLAVKFRAGAKGASSYGLKLEFPNIKVKPDFELNTKLSLWNQPKLLTDTISLSSRTYGASLTVGGIKWVNDSFAVKGNLTVKSAGFEPGEPLDASMSGRIGLSFSF